MTEVSESASGDTGAFPRMKIPTDVYDIQLPFAKLYALSRDSLISSKNSYSR